jgi:hypothetical protein
MPSSSAPTARSSSIPKQTGAQNPGDAYPNTPRIGRA